MHFKLDDIAQLWAQGVITEEIARRLDMTKGSVCRLARDARLRGDPRFPARGRFDMTKRKCVPIPPPSPPPPPKTNPMLLDLKPGECKWPVRSGEERGEHYFCAERQLPGGPYCAEHEALATAPKHIRRDLLGART